MTKILIAIAFTAMLLVCLTACDSGNFSREDIDNGASKQSELPVYVTDSSEKSKDVSANAAENNGDEKITIDTIKPSGPVGAEAAARGNTSGNIHNYGNVAQEGDWIYFSDDIKTHKLCKSKSDGTEFSMICDDPAAFINAVDGWIYYSSLGTDVSHSLGLNRVRTDGSQLETLSDEGAYSVTVTGGYIYYTDDPYSGHNQRLYRMSTETLEVSSLHQNLSGREFCIYDGWIYFVDSNVKEIFKMRVNGTDCIKLTDVRSLSLDYTAFEYSNISVEEGWVYYFLTGLTVSGPNSDSAYRGEAFFFRMREDGSDSMRLTSPVFTRGEPSYVEEWKYIIDTSMVHDSWIYYLGGHRFLYRMSITDPIEENLGKWVAGNRFYIHGDWIYFYTLAEDVDLSKDELSDEDIVFARMHLDGSKHQELRLYPKTK